MVLSAAQIALLKEWRVQFNQAEGAMKIAEKTDENFQYPSVVELRYSGRRIVEFFDLLEAPSLLESPDDKIRAAISDCHRARHDATDYATFVISSRVDEARKKFGADAVRAVFPDYSELLGKLARINSTIADSRNRRHDRAQLYSLIETTDLPAIRDLFDRFRAVEADLEDNYLKRAIAEFGVRFGWIAALLVGLAAWFVPRSPG